jgi:membrane-bound lytic murein transglycosylase MltF
MNYPFFVFIFLLGFFVSCSNTPKKVSKKQDNSISSIDTVRFLAVNDSTFVRVSDKDTIGYAIDVLNRFSEEVGVPYRLILCSNTADVINKFSNGYGNLFLASTLHDSIAIEDQLLHSYSIVQRNTPLKAQEIVSISQASNPTVNQMPTFVLKGIQAMISEIPDKHILVQSKFRVQPKDSLFMNKLNAYIRNVEYRADIAFLKNFYFGVSLPVNMRKYLVPRFRDGVLSPYDKLFKSAAEKYDWDWKLLAAISFKESRFNPNAIGGGGAFGLMQFMPSIGRKYGVSSASTPQQQINAGMKLLYSAYTSWSHIPSKEQRIKFTLASYNAGKAHIDDAQRLAKKHGLNPLVWDGNVQLMVNNLSLSKYYNDDVVKFGAYHGKADRYANLVYQIYLSWKVQ